MSEDLRAFLTPHEIRIAKEIERLTGLYYYYHGSPSNINTPQQRLADYVTAYAPQIIFALRGRVAERETK